MIQPSTPRLTSLATWYTPRRGHTLMPSPFPGMDPYLEGSEWASLHVELSSEIARQLAPQLRPKYVVRTMRQCMTEVLDDLAITAADIYPDKRVPQVSIEIRDVAHRDLVTAIEV